MRKTCRSAAPGPTAQFEGERTLRESGKTETEGARGAGLNILI
ncbi:MAG: hypothetical protein D084_Lepto4C00430G0001 [Leptospirillum sp. Group IV 'UBA BS']|nr:MAG: hypothetical protein D084_Lepto4C00430G0001 [Leptospirillum sp. Group IV 'UBA BS']